MLNESARVLIWDRNPGYFFRSRLGLERYTIPGPEEISKEFARHAFATELLIGANAVPRQPLNGSRRLCHAFEVVGHFSAADSHRTKSNNSH